MYLSVHYDLIMVYKSEAPGSHPVDMCNEMILCSASRVRAVTSSDGRPELRKLNHFGALLNPFDSPCWRHAGRLAHLSNFTFAWTIHRNKTSPVIFVGQKHPAARKDIIVFAVSTP